MQQLTPEACFHINLWKVYIFSVLIKNQIYKRRAYINKKQDFDKEKVKSKLYFISFLVSGVGSECLQQNEGSRCS